MAVQSSLAELWSGWEGGLWEDGTGVKGGARGMAVESVSSKGKLRATAGCAEVGWVTGDEQGQEP